MRCRDVQELWDQVREDCGESVKEAVDIHLRACPHCQELYEEFEGVAYCLSCLPQPEPSCDLTKRVVEHIASIRVRERTTPVVLTSAQTPIGRLYVGFKEARIAYVGIDTGEDFEQVRTRVESRLRRPVVAGEAPPWLTRTLEQFFNTWRVDDQMMDIEDLTPFEQAALRAAAQIPPGEVRSYSWVATQIGRPRAARAVGQVMARNPLALLFPCHRVVDAQGQLHNYGYGIEMKARLLKMEGYIARKL
ncbi:MAG TPA: methylated-DNA--[protein]-cysteine S-methyltransferase [Candidatus Acidoferrum sp.]|jgi:O-6-methylguanine DNA methyltransferase|nr:methylated-DNA--[protein]-cysteine S-methyltransferase [Candidatus Acidoferrum sp.]